MVVIICLAILAYVLTRKRFTENVKVNKGKMRHYAILVMETFFFFFTGFGEITTKLYLRAIP